MFDRNHKKWLGNGEKNELRFEWNDVEALQNQPLNDISIAVTKVYPELSIQKLKSIAYGIKKFPTLKEGDGIIGVSGTKTILKYGYVTSNNYLNNQHKQIQVKFKWLNAQPIEIENDIFNPDLEIQSLNKKALPYLNQIVEEYHFDYLIARENRISEETISASEISFIEETPLRLEDPKETDEYSVVPLFYGTNRNSTDAKDINEMYGDKVDNLKLGICEVTIPKIHKEGELERPWKLCQLLFGENKEKHIVLNQIDELDETSFLTKFNKVLEITPEKDSLVFIHGYNNTFAEAARRTAQLVYDMHYEGIYSMFSWASDGKKLSYVHDLKTAQNSTDHFKEYITLLLNKTNIEKLHFIAHSMGTTVLVFTLEKLLNDPNIINKLNIIKQIVLGAGDLEQGTFKTLLSKVKNIGLRRTIYASNKDTALKKSILISRGLQPIGIGGSDLFVENDVDTVDSTYVKSSGNHHSYVFEVKELLYDLYYLLRENFEPGKRRLYPAKKNGINFWFFPK